MPESSLGCEKQQEHTLEKAKNDTALILVLNTFKITTFSHLERKSNMTESFF